MVRKAALIISLSLAAPATAQTTNCQWFGSTWSCNSTQPVQPQGGGIDWGILQRGEQERAQQQAQQQQYWADLNRQQQEQKAAHDRQVQESYDRAQAELAQQKQALLREDVGRLLQAGDCQGAQNKALAAGDIELAAKAKDFCAKP